MDSWTLQGDSYSFLRSTPRSFSLCHRDGTPNHVEIFDIINVQTQRSAISETTCLCDIFGDDCESPSLSSTPTSGPVPSHTEVDGRAVASPLVDDLNDSSGSYHTAQGSSEGEEVFEDSRERLYSPSLQSKDSEAEGKGLNLGQPGVCKDIRQESDPKTKSPVTQLGTALPSPEIPSERSPSPGLNNPDTLSPEGRVSSLSSSSGERSLPSPNPRQDHSSESRSISPTSRNKLSPSLQSSTESPSPEARNGVSSFSCESLNTNSLPESTEAQVPPSVERSLPSPNPRQDHSSESRSITPTSRNKLSPTLQSSTESPFPEARDGVSSSSCESLNTHSLPESTEAQIPPEQRGISYNHESCPPSGPISKGFSVDLTTSIIEPRVILSSPLPSPSSTESRETSVSPELKDRSSSPDIRVSSPFAELRGRVSVPDLFSRGSTPGIEDPPGIPDLNSYSPTAGGDTSTTPEKQDAGLSAEPGSAVSSPAPRYTPPSPVTSSTSTPELGESSVSPELKYAAPSPGQLSAASLPETRTRTPSPGPSPKTEHTSPLSETRSQDSSPVISYNLSPSPDVRRNYSPIQHQHTAPSPEIRIIASSPVNSRREESSEVELTSDFLDPHLDSASSHSRSLASSPHITSICYSVIQPEDRDIHSFPELSCLYTSQPKRTRVSPEARSPISRSPTSSRDSTRSSGAESTVTPRDSPHITGFTHCVLRAENSETSPSPQHRNPTASPEPRQHTPSPEPRYQTPSPERYQSPSPRHRSRDSSPITPSPELRYHQHSLVTPPTVLNTQYTQPTPALRDTPEVEGVSSSLDISVIEHPTYLTKDRVSPSSVIDIGDKSVVAEIKSSSPLVITPLAESTSPVLSEEKVLDSSLTQQSTDTETTPSQINHHYKSSLASFSEEKQDTGPAFVQKEDLYCNSPIEIKSPSSNLLASIKDRSPSNSPTNRATSTAPVQRLEYSQSQISPHSLSSDSGEINSSLKTNCIRERSRRKPLPKVRRESKDRFVEDMAHHAHRRRTPSPPLTRFTPVHIIAPEKPRRQWQNRSRSPTHAVASSPSSNLKKPLTNRESPNVAPSDNNSQANWVKLGRQPEMEREMQLEEEKELGRERQRVREMERERERKREEWVPEKGEGWQGDASYRGEQVELSFSARNRKGPVSRNTAPTSRETRQGMPTAHSYTDSSLATKQLQQQQSLVRAQTSQQDSRGGGPSRRLQPPAPQNKGSALGRVATNRPGRSSSSSMGSELDEADDEVKWFTDVAFRSLSSPEVDYLDMYNSSHRSSTNVSQPSTQESPAGVSAAWLAYADFRGSAPKLDNDEFSFQQPSTYYSDGLDPSKRYEMGSFECVDVAVEREDSKRVKRGVPKRQIQLKRKNHAETKQDESSENSSPGIPVILDSPFLERHSRETLVRQHSTPAAMQESYHQPSPGPDEKGERKSKLQKSVSLDESCAKTQLATCVIKNVLSKKMQNVDKQPDDQVGEEASTTSEERNSQSESAVALLKDSPKTDTPNLSSSLHSDYSLSSDGLREEPSTQGEVRPHTSSNRPSTYSSKRSDETDSQSRNVTSLRPEMRSQLKVPFDSKQSTLEKVVPRTGIKGADASKAWEESEGGDSANATDRNTGAHFPTGGSSMQARVTKRDRECENTEDHKQLQQGDKSTLMTKTQEINLKAISTAEKKKTSLNVALTSEVANKSELRHEASSPEMSSREKEQRIETRMEGKAEEEEGNGNNKAKVPIHKVRDVRRLVKNTYNLSFKATSAVTPSDEIEETREYSNEEKRNDIKEEAREQSQEVRKQGVAEEEREVKEEERKDDQKVEVRDEKLLKLSPLPHRTGKPLSRQQPMQIECKAVCWKEDKNKPTPCKLDPEKQGEKPQVSPQLINETSGELKNSSWANTQNYTTGDAPISMPCQPDLREEAETKETTTEAPDNEDKHVVMRRDRKPPMLGSLPKLPSKEREVSTAVVVIRDGSSKTKASASPAQEEIQAPVTSPSPGPITPASTPGSSSHSVSMLLKEKDYQADIGAVVGDVQNGGGGKCVPHKHVNCLEIPLQTTTHSDGGHTESRRERTFSSSSTTSGPTAVCDKSDTHTKTRGEEEEVSIEPAVKDAAKQKSDSPPRNAQQQTSPLTKQKEQGDFEAVKRQDPTFPPRSPALRKYRPQPIEVTSLSKETQKQEMPSNITGNNRPQTIEVKSIAKCSQKPIVPPKPNYKFKPADLGAMTNEPQRSAEAASCIKPQSEERPQTIVVSSPTIYRKISNEATLTSNYTRKLAVSAVSSCRPPPGKTTAAATTCVSNQPTAPSETEASNDRGQQLQPGAQSQSSRYTQRPTTLATAPTSASDPGTPSGEMSDLTANQIPGPPSAGASQANHPTVVDLNSQPQYPRMAYHHEQATPMTSNNTKQNAPVSTTQAPGYAHVHQSFRRSLSSERSQRIDDLRFYASDDPPSYDERESFSPLMPPDLTHRRSSRYQPSSRPPPCSCTSGCPSHPGPTPPHHHRSPHSLTPPATSHSPSQGMPYPATQPPHRPHQCRLDPQPMSYRPSSPKSSPLGPNQPSAMYQPLHQPPVCPPHHPLMQACPPDRQLPPPQHMDPRRPPIHRSPQQQPQGMAGGPYNDPGHSPSLPHMDPQYLCGPQGLGPSYGSEYGGDGSSLFSESNYGQTPRRVLMDPETGKYFYIEMPVQPLRKMLFDPETGQYVEVLIPQQAMSHSGLYPPSAAPYPTLHNPNMYAPAQQYMPYAAPPPAPHPQAQPPRYPETSASATMHSTGAGVSYSGPSGQGSKPEPQNHPPMDQSYLESMYYVPTGMNASPNPTPPDYYHKHPPGLPPTGGKRS